MARLAQWAGTVQVLNLCCFELEPFNAATPRRPRRAELVTTKPELGVKFGKTVTGHRDWPAGGPHSLSQAGSVPT